MLCARLCAKCFKCHVHRIHKIILVPLFAEKGAEKQGSEVICSSHMLIRDDTSLARTLSSCVIVPPSVWLGMSKPQIEGVIKETEKYQYLSSASNPHTFSHQILTFGIGEVLLFSWYK